jgi:hypothetical protein
MTTSFRWLGVSLAVIGISALASAETPAPDEHGAEMMQHHPSMQHSDMPAQGMPTQPGQAAFGAVQEIVRMLEADHATDWSKANIVGLREHLIDMDEVTMRAAAKERPVDGGLRIEVTGTARTLAAIQRMVPAHAQELDRFPGWHARADHTADGVVLTVTGDNPQQAARIRGLSFIGLMASGSHHQQHHLAMAKGEFQH